MEEFAADIIKAVHVTDSQAHVVTVTRDNPELKIPQIAAEFPLPDKSLKEIEQLAETVSRQISVKEEELDALAGYLPAFRKALIRLRDEKTLAEVGSGSLANEHFFMAEGWIPADWEESLRRNFPELAIVSREPVKGVDTPPVKLRNNWFVRPFEQFERAFTGISYFSAIDTTWTIAVLFPVFAAFCLNDAGYGLVIAITGLWMAKRDRVRDFGRIAVITGTATTILGILTAQFFGLAAYKPILNLGDSDFALKASLAIGVLVTLFALTIAVIKNGWKHNATGTILFLVGLCLSASSFFIGKIAIAAGVVFWVLFPDSIFGSKIADAIWQCYGTIAALFGDTLSYLRLFALSISGSLLAAIIDEFASKFPPGVNILFLAGAHSLLLALSLISVYIHANRLIFLEFGSRCIDSGNLFYQPFFIGDKKTNA